MLTACGGAADPGAGAASSPTLSAASPPASRAPSTAASPATGAETATSASASPSTSSAAEVAASASPAAGTKLDVVATYSILGDLVQNVGGELVNLRTLVGPGGDPHVYEPTPQDSAALAEAALVFENGLAFETWLDDLFDASGSQAERVVVTEQIEPLPAADDHEHAAGEADDETPSISHRLLVGDAESGRVHVLDVNAGEALAEFELEAPASFYPSADGRYAFAVQGAADRVDVIDGGVFEEIHDDHSHFKARKPKTLDVTLEGDNPVHFVVHDEQIAVFYDDSGTAVVYQQDELDQDNPDGLELPTGKPQHGVAVPLGEQFLLSVPDPAAEDGELPLGVNLVDSTGAVLQEFDACAGLHGEAVRGNTVAFACADGILLLDRDGDSWSSRKLAYPKSAEDDARAGTLVAHPDLSVIVGNFEPNALIAIDPAAGSIARLELPAAAPIYRFAVDPVGGTRIVVLTADGMLHVADAMGQVQGSVQVVDAFSLERDNKDPRPALTLSQNVAFVSSPLSGEVVEVLLDGPSLGRRMAVEGRPQRVALVGLLDQPALLAPVAADEEHAAEHAEDGEHSRGEWDPHVWNDPNNAILMVEAIRDALVATDPNNAATYTANAEAYLTELAELDTWVAGESEALPQERRKLVTTHDTFGYFADRYGYQVVGTALGSVSTAVADPSAGEVAALVEQIKAAGVPAVFAESSNNPALMEQIAAEAGVQLAPTLYPESLSEPGGPADTYLELVRHNVATIVTALGRD